MQPAKLSYKIYQGSTFQEAYRWESQTKVYKPIQSISKAAPCVVTTTTPHELPVGWRFRVVGAGGMKEINNSNDSYYLATGYTLASQALYDTWFEQEQVWEAARDEDASTIAPATRPWANMPSYDAYTILMNYTASNGVPTPPSNLATIANSAKQAHTAWQTDTTEATTIEINQVNSSQYTTYTNGGVVEYNKPVDLTGFKARMQIRKTVNSSDVIYTASSDTGEIDIDLVYSSITLTIPASVTQNFNFTAAVYSMELYNNDGKVLPFIIGNLTLIQEITR